MRRKFRAAEKWLSENAPLRSVDVLSTFDPDLGAELQSELKQLQESLSPSISLLADVGFTLVREHGGLGPPQFAAQEMATVLNVINARIVQRNTAVAAAVSASSSAPESLVAARASLQDALEQRRLRFSADDHDRLLVPLLERFAHEHSLPPINCDAAGGLSVDCARSMLAETLGDADLKRLDKEMSADRLCELADSLQRNPEWHSKFPRQLLFFVFVRRPLSRRPALAVFFCNTVARLIEVAYAIVISKRAALPADAPGVVQWREQANEVVSRGFAQVRWFKDDDVDALYYIAGAAIGQFVRGRQPHRLDNRLLAGVLSALVSNRDAVKRKGMRYTGKTLAMELHGGLVFCEPVMFESLFLPIGKLMLTLPACRSIDHYKEMVLIVRSSEFVARVRECTAVWRLSHALQGDDAAQKWFDSLVIRGICGKFIRILLSVQLRELTMRAERRLPLRCCRRASAPNWPQMK